MDVASAEGGFAVEGATGSLLFSEGRVTISGLSLRYAGGTVDLGGTILLDGLKPTGIRISALVSHVKVSPFEGFRATFSGNLLLLGDSQPRAVRGELVFDRAIYDRDFSIDLASLLQRKRVATVGANPTVFDPVTLDVRLVAPPESIEVRTNVARLKASGELFARGTWGHPLLFGEIKAEEGGRLTLQGQRYDLVSGRILFSNPIRIEPFFELEAHGHDQPVPGHVRPHGHRLAPLAALLVGPAALRGADHLAHGDGRRPVDVRRGRARSGRRRSLRTSPSRRPRASCSRASPRTR